MKSDFKERRESRIDRLEERAIKARTSSDAEWEKSHKAVQDIVPGQPILVGHHSEKKHRRAIQKSTDAAFRALDLQKKADGLSDRAEAALNNTAIFSDDPDATEKLEDKIKRLEARQALMIEANKAIRKKDVHRLAELGYAFEEIPKMLEPDRFGDLGYPAYAISNNGANIRNAKKRLAQLERLNSMETKEVTIGDIRIVQNADENRTQVFFKDIPTDAIRADLKRSGFKWARSIGCWQRHLSQRAFWLAKDIAKTTTENNKERSNAGTT